MAPYAPRQVQVGLPHPVNAQAHHQLALFGPNSLNRRKERSQWHEQGTWRFRQRDEAMVLVKSCCILILCIHHQCIRSDLRASGTVECIGQQRTAQTLPLECLIDGQAAHANGGHGGIARQLPADACRKVGQQQACRCQGVVARDALAVCQCHKTGSYPATNVLGGVLTQVAVERVRVAVVGGAVMLGLQLRKQDWRTAPSDPERKSWLRRAKARCKAGDGCGGDNNACAKHA